jgi:glycine/D-amino acid oxidase-like deaminating enzyme
MRVLVAGAGAFGGWTALELVRRGAAVRLVDAWGPGNARASSGGETRVIRATYGSHHVYTRMARRALDLWRADGERHGQGLLRTTGALWMFAGQNPFISASKAALRASGLPLEEVSPAEARRRYPQIDFSGVAAVLFEPEAGYLRARDACEHIAARVAAEGGSYSSAAVRGPVRLDGPLRRVTLADGSSLEADVFVFACGPWMPSLFPDVLGSLIAITRQEIYYFGPDAGDSRFTGECLPVWLDAGERFVYGIPGDVNTSFKVADDTPGPPMDPTTDDRVPDAQGVDRIRGFLSRRFPALSGAPLVRAEVCQYESTPDAHFIIDRHPLSPNVWLVGGGSGHGFKMGPAVGELVASLVLGEAAVDPAFALARFASPPPGGWRAKWS